MRKKTKTQIKFALFVILTAFAITHLTFPVMAIAPAERQYFLPINPDKKDLSVADKITIAAMKNGIDINEALGISWCESRHFDKAKNSVSTARGVYQFIFKTWDNYCEGDVKNADDNIACFMKLYPKHKGWWECAKILGYTK